MQLTLCFQQRPPFSFKLRDELWIHILLPFKLRRLSDDHVIDNRDFSSIPEVYTVIHDRDELCRRGPSRS